MTLPESILQSYQRRVGALQSRVLLLEALLNEERDGGSRRCVGDGCSAILGDGRLLSGWSVCVRCAAAMSKERSLDQSERRRKGHQRKSHCKNGHRLTPANVYVTPDGDRSCRACRRGANQAWRARRHASA